jgi:hypothetical protein
MKMFSISVSLYWVNIASLSVSADDQDDFEFAGDGMFRALKIEMLA